jgi:hypothetical protein
LGGTRIYRNGHIKWSRILLLDQRLP